MKNYFVESTNLETLKKEYRKLAMKYHPDMTNGNEEVMKQINNEYEKLFEGFKINNNQEAKTENSKVKYTNEMPMDYINAINAVINLESVEVELCGSWLWVSGATYKYKEIFKKAGYNWSKSKKEWYWQPEIEEGYKFYRGNKTKDQIRKTWGSEIIENRKQKQIA